MIVGAVAALFALAVGVRWWTGRVDLREGSRVVAASGPPQRFSDVPSSYQIVYRIENHAGGKLVATTERVSARRPFDSRVESLRGFPPGTTSLSVRMSAFGVLTSRSPSAAPLNIAVPITIASGDLRMDAVIPDALDRRVIERREQREVFGRRCQIYRAGGPVDAGDVTPYKGKTGEYADVCVERHGLVLEEMWYSNRRLLRRRAATQVEINPPFDDRTFVIDVPATPDRSHGSVERQKPSNARGVPLWSLPASPSGFSSLGAYVVTFPSAAIPQSGGAPEQSPVSTTSVFVRGADLLVVDQDPSLAVAVANDNRPSEPVDLGALGRGSLILSGRTSEVRATPNGTVVRLFGTLSPSELVRLARSMVKP